MQEKILEKISVVCDNYRHGSKNEIKKGREQQAFCQTGRSTAREA